MKPLAPRRILAFFLVTTLFSTTQAKKNAPIPPFFSAGEGPHFVMDYTNFMGSEQSTLVEFYIQTGYRDVQFIKHGKRFLASYNIVVSILDGSDRVVETYETSDTFEVNTFKETESGMRFRVLQVNFSLKPGTYTLLARMTDLETRKSTEIRAPIRASNYTVAALQVSEIQLSRKIEATEEETSPFVKNQRYIEPNALRQFAAGAENVWAYFEIYHLQQDEVSKNEYRIRYTLLDASGKVLFQLQKTHQKPGTTCAHSVMLPATMFKNGGYRLSIQAEDIDSGQTAELSKSFLIVEAKLPSVSQL